MASMKDAVMELEFAALSDDSEATVRHTTRAECVADVAVGAMGGVQEVSLGDHGPILNELGKLSKHLFQQHTWFLPFCFAS